MTQVFRYPGGPKQGIIPSSGNCTVRVKTKYEEQFPAKGEEMSKLNTVTKAILLLVISIVIAAIVFFAVTILIR